MDPTAVDLKDNWLVIFVQLKAASSTKRFRLIQTATEDGLLKTLYLLCRNLYYAKVLITPKEKEALCRYKKQLKHLACSATKAKARQQLFLKHEHRGDRGLLSAILTPFIRALRKYGKD